MDTYPNYIPEAYHGTSASAAKLIENEGYKLSSFTKKKHPFLGEGIYFYEGQIQPAINFAKRSIVGKIAVLCSSLDLGRILDFTNQEDFEVIEEVIEQYFQDGFNISDGMIIDFAIKKLDITVNTVKCYEGVRPSGTALQLTKIDTDETPVVICVKNVGAISNTRIVYEEQ